MLDAADRLRTPTGTRSSGFTLIELMIGITILAIVLAAGLPSFSQWIHNSRIRTAAESITHGMQKARAEAVSRNTTIAFVLGNGTFWSILQGATVIESMPSAETASTISVTSVPTPPATNSPTTITFSGMGIVIPNTDGTASITQVDVDSTAISSADSRDLRIVVAAGGAVRMCDPNVVSTSDPRKC